MGWYSILGAFRMWAPDAKRQGARGVADPNLVSLRRSAVSECARIRAAFGAPPGPREGLSPSEVDRRSLRRPLLLPVRGPQATRNGG